MIFMFLFFGLVLPQHNQDKAANIKALRALDMIHKNDTPRQVEFYYNSYMEMISLFVLPYSSDTFDFSGTTFFDELYEYGERLTRMPEFKQPRGVKHFIYINRTNFGLYTILHDLKATVKTNTFRPHIDMS